jgi:hypothetical protein
MGVEMSVFATCRTEDEEWEYRATWAEIAMDCKEKEDREFATFERMTRPPMLYTAHTILCQERALTNAEDRTAEAWGRAFDDVQDH